MSLREKSEQYVNHLIDMCGKIESSEEVQRAAQSFIAGASRIHRLLRAYSHSSKRQNSYTLSLAPNWKVELEDTHRVLGLTGTSEIHFGGEIEFRNHCLSRQIITVVILFRAESTANAVWGRPRLKRDEYHVVRRFHFDFDLDDQNKNRPLAHLQFGGNLNRDYLDIPKGSCLRYELFDQLDTPRFPWSIMDLPRVLDTFLRQFDVGFNAFVEGRPWRELVMKSEQLWLRDFLKQAVEILDSTSNRAPFFEYCWQPSAYDN